MLNATFWNSSIVPFTVIFDTLCVYARRKSKPKCGYFCTAVREQKISDSYDRWENCLRVHWLISLVFAIWENMFMCCLLVYDHSVCGYCVDFWSTLRTCIVDIHTTIRYCRFETQVVIRYWFSAFTVFSKSRWSCCCAPFVSLRNPQNALRDLARVRIGDRCFQDYA